MSEQAAATVAAVRAVLESRFIGCGRRGSRDEQVYEGSPDELAQDIATAVGAALAAPVDAPVGLTPWGAGAGGNEARNDPRCTAVCLSGPGGQSRWRCELPAGHDGEHMADRMYRLEWESDGERTWP